LELANCGASIGVWLREPEALADADCRATCEVEGWGLKSAD
jgi:hypothetical protein